MKLVKPYLKYYKYIALVYALSFLGFMLWDDWGLISRYWKEHWLDYLLIYGLYMLVYFVPITLTYAGICVVIHLGKKRKLTT